MAFAFNHGDRPLSGYTIERGVGRGGFGEVYYARSDGGKEVALKYLRENPQIELRGVAHCLNLKSPYLVGIHDVKQSADGDFFVIMEYVSGPSLRDLLNSEPNGLGTQKAAYFLKEICKGLSYLHDRGIVHRDLKPGNIFYEDGYVKIGDYGLAKIMAASQHSGQTVSVGTVHYMAPEVGSGNYDRTIDIYALGVMLYEMLLGRVPYSGATMGEVLMKHLTAQPAVDELPEPFPRVIRKALAKDPKERYQTVEEMSAAIFAVDEINKSVAGIDSLNLTRMAAEVAKKIKVHAGDRGVGVAAGSSNVVTLSSPRHPSAPPKIANHSPRYPGSAPAIPPAKGSEDDFFGFNDALTFPQRYRTTTGLLGLFLGMFGIHRFYTGHNRIAFFQIILTIVTGVGALWGMIEGIQILAHGNFRDSMGRPLLDRPRRAAHARSSIARMAWGIACLLLFFGGLALLGGATFAPPEYEQVGWSVNGQSYHMNTFHLMYFFASAALSLAIFAAWKAAHRGGLSIYRATVRPAMMCACLAMMGIATAAELNLLAGSVQIIGIIVVLGAAVVFLFASMLRGPEVDSLPNDLYWNRAWINIFATLGILFTIGGGLCYREYHSHRGSVYQSEREPLRTFTAQVQEYQSSASGRDEVVEVERQFSVPNIMFDHYPVAAALFIIAAAASLLEMRHRWCLVRRATRQSKSAAAVAQAS